MFLTFDFFNIFIYLISILAIIIGIAYFSIDSCRQLTNHIHNLFRKKNPKSCSRLKLIYDSFEQNDYVLFRDDLGIAVLIRSPTILDDLFNGTDDIFNDRPTCCQMQKHTMFSATEMEQRTMIQKIGPTLHCNHLDNFFDKLACLSTVLYADIAEAFDQQPHREYGNIAVTIEKHISYVLQTIVFGSKHNSTIEVRIFMIIVNFFFKF